MTMSHADGENAGPRDRGSESLGSSTLRIRRGVPGDAAWLAELGARTFVETYGSDNTPGDMAKYVAATYGESQQRAELESKDTEYVLAEVGAELAGFALLWDGPPPENVPGTHAVEIRRFYVSGAMHGRGVAAELMRATRDAARRRGADALWLGVWGENRRAIRFYEKQGFAVVGRQSFVLGDDEQSDLVMARLLGDGERVAAEP
jgi:ribosomal protein S18 acetylase RimI-like enzyme